MAVVDWLIGHHRVIYSTDGSRPKPAASTETALNKMTIILYDLAGDEDERRFSPNCWRIKMALAHKGLEFEAVPWRFTEKDAIAFSGQGLVPVLVDGSATVYDSWRIALYLDKAYPERPLLIDSEQARG